MNNFDFCGGNDNACGHDMNALAKSYNQKTRELNGFSKPVIRKRKVKQITPWVG